MFALLHVAPPSDTDIARHAAAAKEHKNRTGEWADESGWSWALSEVLVKGGVTPKDASHVVQVIRYPVTPDDVVHIHFDIGGEDRNKVQRYASLLDKLQSYGY